MKLKLFSLPGKRPWDRLKLQEHPESLTDRKKTIINLQWVVVIATSYLCLFRKGEVVHDPWVYGLIVLFLGSILLLTHLRSSWFTHRLFAPALVIVDTVLISLGISLNRDSPWDLYLIFFFGLSIAALGENLIQIVVGCFIISFVSVIANSFSAGGLPALDADSLLRIPFIFGVSILYGHLAEQVKKEKGRAKKLQETEQLKRQLVSALAHDIKNPLGVIGGYADILETELREPPSRNGQLEAVQRIQDNTQRIVKLVTGFLDASRVEAGKVELTPEAVQLNHLIREVGIQQMGDLRKKEISLEMDLDEPLPDILGDEAQMERVLWNLVGNAIKFTPVGGSIKVSSRAEGDHVSISVKDTGVGIPEEELSHLFKEFKRLKGTGNIEGTGLGLFIVKTIVEAHGGTIHAESKPEEGSNFIIRIPAGQEP